IDLHEQAVQDAEKLDWKERRAGLHILTGDAIVNAQRTAKMRQELDADDDVPPVPLDTAALARAREHSEIASRLAQGKDQELIGMVAEDGLAEVAESLDDRAQRRQRFESLLAMARRAKAAGHEVSALLGPAALANRQGDAGRPGALGAEVYRMAGRLGNPEAQIRVLTALAAHAAKAGDPARARDRHLMALKLAAKADDGDSLTAVGFLLSEVLADEDLAVGAA
ncbi:MAG: hypothetical protein LBT54_06660, partial [Bifidobacteriaceae bacterium]|nr:hypothetical protein [Bifidobacteriaceae bacterium]